VRVYLLRQTSTGPYLASKGCLRLSIKVNWAMKEIKYILIIFIFAFLLGFAPNYAFCQKEGGSYDCTYKTDDGQSHDCRCSVVGDGDAQHTVCTGDCY